MAMQQDWTRDLLLGAALLRRRLLMDVDDKPDGKRARYDFVLDLR